jgi:hypothetical protein
MFIELVAETKPQDIRGYQETYENDMIDHQEVTNQDATNLFLDCDFVMQEGNDGSLVSVLKPALILHSCSKENATGYI